jgi:predicted dienelactone hydrolase
MMKRKRLVIFGIVLLVIALGVAFLFQEVQIPEQPISRPETLQYSGRGPYAVGIRNRVIESESPLEITIWYPALEADGYEMITSYPFVFKTSDVLSVFGNLTVAKLGAQAIQDAPFDFSESPYPVVVSSHGFSMAASNYAWLAEHLASNGFVVVAPEHQEGMDPGMNDFWRALVSRPQEILTVFDYLDEQVEAGGELEGVLNPQLVAVIGHSYGGYTTLAAAGAQIDFDSFEQLCAETTGEQVPGRDLLCNPIVSHEADIIALAGFDMVPTSLWPAWADPRVDAIIQMAGDAYLFNEEGLKPINIPVMAMGGTQDSGTPFVWGAQPTFEYVSSPKKIKIGFQGAEHMVFAGTCQSASRLANMAIAQLCFDPVWGKEDFHSFVGHYATAFLLAELKQDQDAAAILKPEMNDFSGVDYQAESY